MFLEINPSGESGKKPTVLKRFLSVADLCVCVCVYVRACMRVVT